MVDGLNLGKVDNTEVEFAKNKITKLSFQMKPERSSKRPLELIHNDVCGPISPASYDKKKYFLTFIDDYTHFTVVYLIKNKSEIFDYFKNYEAIVTAK